MQHCGYGMNCASIVNKQCSTDLQTRRWMMSKMPRYEVRYDANEGWIEISDLEFMDELYKLYRRVTPVIKEMING